jgi:hypothetical protein
MKVHSYPMEKPTLTVLDGDEGVVVAIEVYYDPHLKLWTGYAVDENGYQVGPALYDMERLDVAYYVGLAIRTGSPLQ